MKFEQGGKSTRLNDREPDAQEGKEGSVIFVGSVAAGF
jgi:hypothetical protein